MLLASLLIMSCDPYRTVCFFYNTFSRKSCPPASLVSYTALYILFLAITLPPPQDILVSAGAGKPHSSLSSREFKFKIKGL